MDSTQAFPLPDLQQLKSEYVGKSIQDAPLPSAILDISKVRRNCSLMLDAVKELNVDFRAHVKTHKTSELTKFQIGSDCKDARLICSTVLELERLQPILKEYQEKGALVNVLYGVPPGLSHVPRLANFLESMGPGSLSLMIDNEAQLETVAQVFSQTQTAIKIFLKTDSGYHRAGLAPASTSMQSLVTKVLQMESDGALHLLGFYSHNSNSYGGNSPLEAMDNLRTEVDACTEAALKNLPSSYMSSRTEPLYISCGASPTALSLQNLLPRATNTAATDSAKSLRASLANARSANIHFEIHAGVYPTLDMQQVSASSRLTDPNSNAVDSIAISILSEICSVYPDRTAHPEALINAGVIALAREPCKAYRGHGVITPWNMPTEYDAYDVQNRIVLDRVSQEHGLLQWEDKSKKEPLPVKYGQRIRVWPNHACITGSHFGWYLVIDSESEQEDVVRDVWVRWRGW